MDVGEFSFCIGRAWPWRGMAKARFGFASMFACEISGPPNAPIDDALTDYPFHLGHIQRSWVLLKDRLKAGCSDSVDYGDEIVERFFVAHAAISSGGCSTRYRRLTSAICIYTAPSLLLAGLGLWRGIVQALPFWLHVKQPSVQPRSANIVVWAWKSTCASAVRTMDARKSARPSISFPLPACTLPQNLRASSVACQSIRDQTGSDTGSKRSAECGPSKSPESAQRIGDAASGRRR